VVPGHVYLVVHSKKAGNFHAAAVVAQDGSDSVTLEADAGSRTTISVNHRIFDMYNEATKGQSFWEDQGSKKRDKVFDLSLGNVTGGLVADVEYGLSKGQKTRISDVMS
jgi:hypothetical protein